MTRILCRTSIWEHVRGVLGELTGAQSDCGWSDRGSERRGELCTVD